MEQLFSNRLKNEMHYRKQQGGMALLGWVFVLALLALLGLAVIRLFPIYIDYFSVQTSLESLTRQPSLQQMSDAEIRGTLFRQMDINGVDHISKDNIKITKVLNALKVAVDYEVRTPFVGNIDLIVHFHPAIEAPSR